MTGSDPRGDDLAKVVEGLATIARYLGSIAYRAHLIDPLNSSSAALRALEHRIAHRVHLIDHIDGVLARGREHQRVVEGLATIARYLGSITHRAQDAVEVVDQIAARGRDHQRDGEGLATIARYLGSIMHRAQDAVEVVDQIAARARELQTSDRTSPASDDWSRARTEQDRSGNPTTLALALDALALHGCECGADTDEEGSCAVCRSEVALRELFEGRSDAQIATVNWQRSYEEMALKYDDLRARCDDLEARHLDQQRSTGGTT